MHQSTKKNFVTNVMTGAENCTESEEISDTENDDVLSWCELCFEETSEKATAAGFCTECSCFLCTDCLTAHKKLPASRTHRILQGDKMPKSVSDKPIKFNDCQAHVGNVKSKFCLHHGEMCCSECIKTKHHRCKTSSIQNVCKGLDNKDIGQFRDVVNNILECISATKTAVQNSLAQNERRRTEQINVVKNLRDNLFAKTEEHCSRMISEIMKLMSKKKTTMSGQISVLSDQEKSLVETIFILDKFKDDSIKANLFIRIQELVEKARQVNTDFENTSKDLHKLEMSCSVNLDVSVFLSETEILEEAGTQGDIKKVNPLEEISFPKALVREEFHNLQFETVKTAADS